jgi:diguanylate cyclase (GGDEF)-like protein/PAS domain S-box-containing protein
MFTGLHPQLLITSFLLVAVTAFVLMIVAWRRSRLPGSLIFAALMAAVVIWLAATAVQQGVVSLTGKVLAIKAAYLGLSWVGTLWLMFSLEYVFPEHNWIQRLGRWLGIFPLANIAVVMTNGLHGWMWSRIELVTVGDQLSLSTQRGWWFWSFIAYTYISLAVGCAIMIWGMHRVPQSHRKQAAGLLIGLCIPWLAHFLSMAGIVPRLEMDLTPLGFVLAGVIYAWTVFRYKLFDLAPLVHRFILENIGEGYLVIDNQRRVIEMNTLAATFLELDLAAYWGKSVTTVLARWPALLDLLRAPEKSPIEIPRNDDHSQYLEASLISWSQNQPQGAGYIIILRDVTRRRMAEENLRESERLYRLVVNTMPVGITITDEVGRITFASPKMREIFEDGEHTEIIGGSVLKFIHPDERGLGMMRLLRVIEEKENLPPQEYRFIHQDGSSFWGEVISTPMLDDAGVAKGLLAIVRDISSRKELEFRLQNNLDQQTFINRLLQTLYRAHDIFSALGQVLEQTGTFTRANRIYLCKDSPDGEETSIVLEWCSIGISPRAQDGILFRYKSIPTWRECLRDRGMLLVEDFHTGPEDIAEYMAAWNVFSLAAFPVYGSEERLYGFLAFDYCDEVESWTDDEIDVLWNVCRIVSGAVAQRQVQEAERHQRILAEALHDTASALNSTLNFEEVLDQILTNLKKIVRHDAASIALVDDENMVRFVRWRGYDAAGEALMRTVRIPVMERITYRTMAETGEPIIISDTWLDKNWFPLASYGWIRAYAGMPIKIKGKIAGFINLDQSQPDSFSPDLIYSLRIFADQAAIAIENARLYNATHRRAEELGILYRIGLTMTAGLEMSQILVSLFEQCREALPIDVFYVALYDAETGRIDLPLFFRDGRFEQVEAREMQKDPGITGEVIRQRKTIYLPDSLNPEVKREYMITRLGGTPVRSYVGVPLILLNQVVGVVSMQNFQPHAYSPEQVRLLETIGTQAAIAVQNARIYDQMKQMAITDTVTQLFTRRHFTQLGRSEVERALRYDRKLSVLMVDIDHFKRINDTFGHTAGDQVLLIVANICRQALRVTDIVGRWGGEEYVIILPEADLEGGALIAERIRRMVAETEIILAEEVVHVTISVGVAAISPSRPTLELLIDNADRALYIAKQSGRDQVQVDKD